MLEKASLNQSVLARAAGIQRTQLCEILNGRRRMSINVAKALSRVTGIPAQDLIFAELDDLKTMLWQTRANWAKPGTVTSHHVDE